jgi:hypothetical protein
LHYALKPSNAFIHPWFNFNLGAKAESPSRMITLVVTINCLIALVNCYFAWKLWQWQGAIAIFTRTVQQLEYQCELLFNPIPDTLTLRQGNLRDLRLSYQTLTLQLLRLQKILVLISFLTKLSFPIPR